MKTKKVALKQTVNVPFVAEKIRKTHDLVTEMWTPEFIEQIPEDYVWKINIRGGYKLYTEEDINTEFVPFEKEKK